MASAGAGLRIDFRWRTDPRIMIVALDQIKGRIVSGGTAKSNVAARAMEAYAKANAPWSDRTGQARGSLYANAVQSGSSITIKLSHGDGLADYRGRNYSHFLEGMQGGRFAVILPTLERYGPVVMSYFNGLMDG